MAVERNSGTLSETEWKRKDGMELLRSGMKVRERRDKISISSAVTEDGDLYFMIVKESMNEDHIIGFLDQLLSDIERFPYLFWDNIRSRGATR